MPCNAFFMVVGGFVADILEKHHFPNPIGRTIVEARILGKFFGVIKGA